MAKKNNELPDTQTQTQNSSCYEHLESQPIKPVWGRLYGKRIKIKSLGRYRTTIIENNSENFDLCNDIFRVGRDESQTDLCLSVNILSAEMLNRISKVHFKIIRDISDFTKPAYIEDSSRNGTFINGNLIGHNNKQILLNSDEISVAHPNIKIFVYKDLSQSVIPGLPMSITTTYHIGKRLGKGACGVVHLVYQRETCKEYALKFIEKNSIVSEMSARNIINQSKHIKNEVQIMKSLHHPCIIKMHDVIDTNESVSILLEYMNGGDLLQRIVKTGGQGLTEPLAKFYFYQLCLSIKYLHEQNITHRDLKPDNILLYNDDDETLLKVSDFGLSKFISNDTAMRTMCGTKLYVAPEILKTHGRGTYTQKVDVWSMGVVLFAMLSASLPFTENNPKKPLVEQIINAHISFKSPLWRTISPEAKSLLFSIFTIDPQKRPSIENLLNHEWLNDINIRNKFAEIKSKLNIINGEVEIKKQQINIDEDVTVEPPSKRRRIMRYNVVTLQN